MPREWGALAALALLYLVLSLGAGRKRTLVVITSVDLTVGAFSLLPILFGASWLRVAVLVAAILSGVWTAIIAGIWRMAPMFQSLRDGSLPTLPRFPFRALGGPALLAAEVIFKSYVIAAFGIWVLLAIEVPVVLLRLLPLLHKHIPGPGH